MQSAPNAERRARQAGRAPAARAQPTPIAPQRRRRVLQVREPAVADYAVDAGRGEVDRLDGLLRAPCLHGHASSYGTGTPDHAHAEGSAQVLACGLSLDWASLEGAGAAANRSDALPHPSAQCWPLAPSTLWDIYSEAALSAQALLSAPGRVPRRLGQQDGHCLPCRRARAVARACRNATLASPCALALRSARPCMLSATSTPTTRPAAPTRCAASSAVLPALGRRACDSHERRRSPHQPAGAGRAGRLDRGAARQAAAARLTCVGSQVDHK